MIEFPPNIIDDFSFEELIRHYENENINKSILKINDEYLYWSDVKYRAQAIGISKEELWALVKYIRSGTDVKISEFEHMHFSLTNFMQRQCHEFDIDRKSVV